MLLPLLSAAVAVVVVGNGNCRWDGIPSLQQPKVDRRCGVGSRMAVKIATKLIVGRCAARGVA